MAAAGMDLLPQIQGMSCMERKWLGPAHSLKQMPPEHLAGSAAQQSTSALPSNETRILTEFLV